MKRSLLLLVLLAGCAAPAALPDGSPSLDSVNASLDGARVRIEFSDGVVIDRATRVHVTDRTIAFHTDRDPRDSMRTVPIAAVRHILRLGAVGANSGTVGALVGAVPGAFVMTGGFALDPEGRGSLTDAPLFVLTKVGLIVGGMALMAVGAKVGRERTRAPAERRSTVLYRAPVSRYLAAPPAPSPSPSDL